MTSKTNHNKKNFLSEEKPSQEQKKENLKKKEDSLTKDDTKKLDPTHFGDWQVGCRTIDF